MWKNCRGAAALLFSVFFASCGGSPPEIASLFYRLEVETAAEEESAHREYLRLFILANDNDGASDLEVLELSCPREELIWTIEGDDLERIRENEELWIGRSRIGTADGGPFPRSSYVVKLFDRGGRQSESVFTLEREIGAEPDLFPRLLSFSPVAGARFSLPGGAERWSGLEIRFYGGDENPLMTAPGGAGENGTIFFDRTIFGEALRQGAVSWLFYGFDRTGSVGVSVGPFTIERGDG